MASNSANGNLECNPRIIEDNVGKWEKLQSVIKQSRTFTKEELSAYLSLTDTPKTLVRKVYAVISLAMSGRVGEMCNFASMLAKMLVEECTCCF